VISSRRFPRPGPSPVRKIETKGRVFLAAPRTRAVTALRAGPPYVSRQGRHHSSVMPEPARRFPPPWSVEEADSKLDRQCFIVRDANGQALTSVCRQEKGALECYEWSRPRR
jgi:hypothetical protein